MGAGDTMGRQMSDNRGVLIGSVASFDTAHREAAVRLSGPDAPEQGDGLVFLSPGQEMGLKVNRPQIRDGLLRLKTPERVRPGAKVFLTSSSALDRKAKEIISTSRAEIPLDLFITWQDGRPEVEAVLPKGRHLRISAGFKMEKARNQPIARQQIESQMRRTGGTPFVVRKLEMDEPGDVFAPLGALNQLRRDILVKAEQALLEDRRPAEPEIAEAKKRLEAISLASTSPGAAPKRQGLSLAVYADSLEAVRGAVHGGCRRVYFEPAIGRAEAESPKRRAEKIKESIEKAKAICSEAEGAELIWKWPKITREDFMDAARLLLASLCADGIMVESPAGAEAALTHCPDVHLYGAAGLNVFNHMTVQALSPPFRLLTLSPELSESQLAAIIESSQSAAPKLELMVQGNLEVMVTEDCIPCLSKGKASSGSFWGLQDLRRVFPLRLDDDGRTHIYNSAETCLLDHLPRIMEMGLDSVAVDVRGRTERYALEMTDIYRNAIELTVEGHESLPEELQRLKERIRPLALGGITYGHFIKGLKDEIT
ncbi:Peptidase family U32 [uncultured archaeon]|nr:Peptidase family U32 [uncultured archaeon]